MKGLLNDPTFAMGIGLLQGAQPGGTFASGAANALQMGQQVRRNNMQQQMTQAQLAEYEQKRQQQQIQQRAIANINASLQRGESPRPEDIFVVDPNAAISMMQPDRTTLQQNLIAAGYQPGSPEFQQAMLTAINKPQTVVQNIPELPSGFVPVDPNDLSKGVKPIPGSSADPVNTQEYRGLARNIADVEASLNTYEGLLNQYGAEVIPGEGQLQLDAAYIDMLMGLKDLYELGALTGPDQQMIERVLADPTSAKAKATEIVSGRKSLVNQLGLVRDKLRGARERLSKQYGAPLEEDPRTGTVNRGRQVEARKSVGGKTYIRIDGEWYEE